MLTINNPIIDITLRATIVYLFIIIAIRIFGKKELAQLSVIDLVFILLISNAVQNAMVGPNTSLLGGLIAAAALFVVNFILKLFVFKSKKFGDFLQGEPIMLVYKGKIVHKNLHKAQISTEELEASIREHGVDSVKDVDLATLEVDGNISVLSHDFTHHTVKKRRAHRILSKNQ